MSAEGLSPAVVEWVEGVPVTSAQYAVSYLMRYARTPWEAIEQVEKAAYDDLVSLAEMHDFLTPRQNGWTGVPLARRSLPLARENSWSPRETHMRRVWVEIAQRPEPLCNVPVFDLSGRHVGTPDLIDPASGVTGEYDGAAHLDRHRRDHDLRREGDFRELGLEPVTMTGPDVGNPARFVRRLVAAYGRAAHRAGSPRAWTLDRPAWWVPTETVAQRRALTPDQRRRFLAYRDAA